MPDVTPREFARGVYHARDPAYGPRWFDGLFEIYRVMLCTEVGRQPTLHSVVARSAKYFGLSDVAPGTEGATAVGDTSRLADVSDPAAGMTWEFTDGDSFFSVSYDVHTDVWSVSGPPRR